MTDKVRRRLTTLLCADAAGYTRLMGADEAGTLATLRRRRAAMATLIERHEGRIVNTWGDAVIAEFASVVEAVQCAVETQQELSSHNGELPEEQQMNFRIGINLGDVMLEGDDVYGDGVNIAARLQELAEPGGILISGPVYDQVHNKLSIGFERLGEQNLKNVAHPVTGYRVLQGGAPPRSQAPPPEPMRKPPTASESAETGLGRAWAWYTGLPRASLVLIAITVFLFVIRVQRPAPNLVSMARGGAAVDRFPAGREGAPTVVGQGTASAPKLRAETAEPPAARRLRDTSRERSAHRRVKQACGSSTYDFVCWSPARHSPRRPAQRQMRPFLAPTRVGPPRP